MVQPVYYSPDTYTAKQLKTIDYSLSVSSHFFDNTHVVNADKLHSPTSGQVAEAMTS